MFTGLFPRHFYIIKMYTASWTTDDDRKHSQIHYLIGYWSDKQQIELFTIGVAPMEHGYYEMVMKMVRYWQHLSNQLSKEEMISKIARRMDKESGVESKPIDEMTDEELESKIDDALNREDYKEVRRLTDELDKRDKQ